jgi:5'-nucleotidase
MPLDLSDTLVIGISATALFDLSEADNLFRTEFAKDRDRAIEIYRNYMLEREDVPLAAGTGLPLVRSLLRLKDLSSNAASPLVEVVVMSRNSPETGLRVLNTIRQLKLGISRSLFTGGESVVDYLNAFDVDLFLTTHAKDAQRVIDSRVCAAALLAEPPSGIESLREDQVRIAFDGDAVLFDEASELVYKTEGLDAFQSAEDAAQDHPLAEGPYALLLKKLARLQERLPGRIEFSPVRIALVTARNSPAEMRAIKTLRHRGVYVDEAFFLGGLEKHRILEAFKPHIFFDDQDMHLAKAADVVPSGKVPYRSDSPLLLMSGESQHKKDETPAQIFSLNSET